MFSDHVYIVTKSRFQGMFGKKENSRPSFEKKSHHLGLYQGHKGLSWKQKDITGNVLQKKKVPLNCSSIFLVQKSSSVTDSERGKIGHVPSRGLAKISNEKMAAKSGRTGFMLFGLPSNRFLDLFCCQKMLCPYSYRGEIRRG